MFSEDILQKTFLGNSVESYLWFAGIILAGIIFKKIISKFLSRVLYKLFNRYMKSVSIEKFLELLTRPVSLFVMLVVLYLAFDRLEFPGEWNMAPKEEFGWKLVIFKTFQMLLFASVTWIVLRIVDFIGLIFLHRATLSKSKLDDQLVPFIKSALKIIILFFGFTIMLSFVFEVNVASLVAGLGIGGLAIALAAKESLENLLGSFTIFLDKPFVIGDLVTIGTITGHVEEIGFRSTRIRTTDKSFVTVPNKKMVDAELDNITKATFRRAKFTIGLTYSTPESKLKAVIHDIKKNLDVHPLINEDAVVCFSDFNTSSLDIKIIFLVQTNDWRVLLRVKEEINFQILNIVASHGCKFAFPTTSVYVEKEEAKD